MACKNINISLPQDCNPVSFEGVTKIFIADRKSFGRWYYRNTQNYQTGLIIDSERKTEVPQEIISTEVQFSETYSQTERRYEQELSFQYQKHDISTRDSTESFQITRGKVIFLWDANGLVWLVGETNGIRVQQTEMQTTQNNYQISVTASENSPIRQVDREYFLSLIDPVCVDNLCGASWDELCNATWDCLCQAEWGATLPIQNAAIGGRTPQRQAYIPSSDLTFQDVAQLGPTASFSFWFKPDNLSYGYFAYTLRSNDLTSGARYYSTMTNFTTAGQIRFINGVIASSIPDNLKEIRINKADFLTYVASNNYNGYVHITVNNSTGNQPPNVYLNGTLVQNIASIATTTNVTPAYDPLFWNDINGLEAGALAGCFTLNGVWPRLGSMQNTGGSFADFIAKDGNFTPPEISGLFNSGCGNLDFNPANVLFRFKFLTGSEFEDSSSNKWDIINQGLVPLNTGPASF